MIKIRDLSINDLCRAVETIIECKEDNRGIYNVASFNNNIMNIGKNIADYIGVKINDNGKNFTYDFKISSEKFIKQFDFKFTDTIQTIVESILSNSHNKNWSKRENK
jgi:hypothetical protein